MDKNSLQKFVANMRNTGSDDETIAQELEKAGHNETVINELLGRSAPADAAAPATSDETPIIDPNNRPQIIKDRSAVLKEAAKNEAAEGSAETQAAAPPAPSSRSKAEVKPQTEGLEPAAINSPTTSQAHSADETETPTVDVATDEPAPAPAPAPAAAPEAAPVIQGMPAVGQQAPAPASTTEAPAHSPIYPDATKGQTAHMHPQPVAPVPAANSQNYPEYIDNPLQLAAYSFSNFFKFFPQMIFASIMGIILAIVFAFVIAFILGAAASGLGESNAAGLSIFGGIGGGIAVAIIAVILYASFFAVYVTLYRSLQLSLALDIAKGDKPDIGGAFNRMFGFFGKIFMVNLRLILKVILLAFGFGIVFYALAFAIFSSSNSLDGLGAAIIFGIISYVAFLVFITVVILRNSFIHLLMLDNSANLASNAARDSVALMRTPRRKHLDVFTWALILGAVSGVFYLLFTLVTPYDYAASEYVYGGNAFNPIGAVLFTIISILLFTVFDIGLARQFHASNGQIKSAARGPRFNILVIPILIASIALTIGLYWTASSIDESRRRDEYERRRETTDIEFNSSSSDSFESNFESSFDPNDYDKNGIPDDEQCLENQIAFPEFIEYDDDFNAIYRIECYDF